MAVIAKGSPIGQVDRFFFSFPRCLRTGMDFAHVEIVSAFGTGHGCSLLRGHISLPEISDAQTTAFAVAVGNGEELLPSFIVEGEKLHRKTSLII